MKKLTRVFAVLLAVMVMFTAFPVQTEAATVKLNKKKVTVYVGQTTTLKITGTGKKVTWSSSDKKVATVSKKGKVTAKKKGTATITAKVGKKSYKCKVTVKNPTINKKNLIMVVGQTYTLKLKGSEIKSAKSDDKSIATVTKNGKVTAKKAWRTAIITLKGKNGKTYECRVTVYPKGYEKLTKLKDGKKYTAKESDGKATYFNWNGHIVRLMNDGTNNYAKCIKEACYADYYEIVVYGEYIGMKIKDFYNLDDKLDSHVKLSDYVKEMGYREVHASTVRLDKNTDGGFVFLEYEEKEEN